MSSLFVQLIADWLVVAIVIIATVALLVYVPRRQMFVVYSHLLIAGILSYWIAKIMAASYQPSQLRPFELLGVEAGASYLNNPGFPSDHALFVWVIVCAVGFATRRWWLVGLLASMACLVCAGRVLAFVHTPLDVFGGMVAALCGACVYLWTEPGSICKNTQTRVQ